MIPLVVKLCIGLLCGFVAGWLIGRFWRNPS